MKKVLFAFGSMALVVVACGGGGGGGSGVSGSKKLSQLSESEVRSICTYLADTQGAERTITCPDMSTITVGIPAAERQAEIDDCTMEGKMFGTTYPNCETTVGQVEDCYEAIDKLTDAQLCMDPPIPAACAPVFMPSANCGGQ